MSSIPSGNSPAFVCPLDHGGLERTADDSYGCAAGHRFAIRAGIPRLVASENSYADAFGEQWKRFRTTQLDSYSGTSISRDRLKRCLGESLWQRLQSSGRIDVLEAGCGAGRFTEILLGLPAAFVTSTDLSSAVEPNQANCPQSERHRIAQSDINALPFVPGQYDIVLCLGVVQHTRSPEETLASLYAQVKPGGSLVFDHYAHMLSRYTKFGSLLLRPVLKRLPPLTGMAATEALTKLFFPMHRAARRNRLFQVLLSRISPLATYFHTIPELGDRLQYEWALLDTHDGLTDWYKHLRSEPQLRRILAGLGAQGIEVAKGGNGIEARCRKPRETRSPG